MPPVARPRPIPQPTVQPFAFPAPAGGLNTASPGTAMPVTDCVLGWNLIPSEAGLRSRLGYREWCTGLLGTLNNKVRSILTFSGSEPSQNRLFATTDTRIYDCTSSTATPATAFTFASSLGNAGYGVGRVVVTPGGHFLLYCDEVNGLHRYAETGATWSAITMGGGPTQISGVDPANLVHVTVFKRRVWFTERNSTSGWYLAPNAIFGTATEFDFGTHFPNGGFLVGLYNWTYDGGAGVDDSLVAISSTGDVVVINGVDPADPTSFNVRGVWNMGPPPTGREIAREVGGDLYLLSSLGILPISRLVVGANKAFETVKIGNLFNNLMLTRRSTRGWSMHLHPEDNALVVLLPDYSTETNQSLAQSQSTKGWFRYRDLPMHCATVWENRLHFGTQDGRVCVSRDYVDNVALAGGTFTEVDFSLITSFQRLGGGRLVNVVQTRTLWIVDGGTPVFTAEARYNYSTAEAAIPDPPVAASGTWDNALWDVDVWGSEASNFGVLRGASGNGYEVAIAVRGKANTRTVLVHVDAHFTAGGFF